jgi:putative nucleotidyltransferase with HDIG domain
MGALLDRRDPSTARHQRRVALVADDVAAELGLGGEHRRSLALAALVHDIGKIGIPLSILAKPGALTAAERAIITTHVEVGGEVLSAAGFPDEVVEVVRQHHERLDGSGYPRGLRGAEIVLEAQILAVSDVLEAVASHRPYRPSLGLERAMGLLVAGRGSLFEPEVVDACLRAAARPRPR